MDPILLQIGPLAVRWYGALIALGVLIGSLWTLRAARRRGLDPDAMLDLAPWLVIAGIIGARLVYVLTSPSAFFGPGGSPLDAFAVWQGGISIHGGVIGVMVAAWIFCRVRELSFWSVMDVLSPVGALGIIGGRIGNFFNGSDTTGRLTGWPVGFTWPEPGSDTFGAFGRVIFGDDLWAGYPGVCSLGSYVPFAECLQRGGEIVRGPVHLTQLYGALVGVILIPILVWALRRSRTPGFAFANFVIWYSILRSVIEEPFRDNPLFWLVYLSEGVNASGIGIFTLTQLVSIPIVLVALYALLVMDPEQEERRDRMSRRARGR